jgi:glutamate-5-semialdehyde dehydrogenase
MNLHAAPVAAADPAELVADCARRARVAQAALAAMPSAARAAALHLAADHLRAAAPAVIAANAQDLAAGRASGLSPAMLDRLALDEARIAAMAAGIAAVADLPDPVGRVIDAYDRPNGLRMQRIRVPIGTIGIIYESRPNVTADAAALCVRAGNAALLRGGSEAVHSNRAIHSALVAGLAAGGVPQDAVQLIPTQDRAAVGAMLTAAGLIDMIVPRGGKGLVARVQADARVPVLAHLDGINHTYIHAAAAPDMARAIAVNAKLRRTGICGAMETLLIDAAFPDAAGLVSALIAAGCEVRGDGRAQALDPRIIPASADDWDTDVIVTADDAAAERFLAEVDSAIVMHNASSQFADGAEFGLGAEIGIATGRLHARGPVALEGLTTYKWQVRGQGQTRP